MTLPSSAYGTGRVRVIRVAGEHRYVRELDVRAMLTGDIDRASTEADDATTVSTDTIETMVNIVAREELETGAELFCRAVAVDGAMVDAPVRLRAERIAARAEP